jgi:U3 small nucleolar RNA-associated protein 10
MLSLYISNSIAYWSSPSRFEKIVHPLLHQLPLSYKTKILIPAIVALTNKAQTDENCKVINTVLMEYIKAEAAGVRLSAVQTQKALFEEVSSEWLKVLPPLVPVISELMEDENEGVVEGTHELIATIESVGGISMQKLLT